MKAAIIGYGKMGREIEKILTERGHEVALVIDINNAEDLNAENCDDNGDEKTAKVFHSCVSIGVLTVCGLSRKVIADKEENRASRIREVIYCIGNNGNTARDYSDGHFNDKEQNVCAYADDAAGLALRKIAGFAATSTR